MDQVFISDLVARGIIRVHTWERKNPQEILTNIVLIADLHKAGSSHDTQGCGNYRTAAKRVLAHAAKAQRQTVEALSADLARLCLQEPGVEQVRVRVVKPGAVRFLKSVGVETERSKEDLA
jgi:FolB domain-containing protein